MFFGCSQKLKLNANANKSVFKSNYILGKIGFSGHWVPPSPSTNSLVEVKFFEVSFPALHYSFFFRMTTVFSLGLNQGGQVQIRKRSNLASSSLKKGQILKNKKAKFLQIFVKITEFKIEFHEILQVFLRFFQNRT